MELELQAIVRRPMWVPGTELSARAAMVTSSLQHQPWDILFFPREHILQELMRVKDKEINPNYKYALSFSTWKEVHYIAGDALNTEWKQTVNLCLLFCFLTKLYTNET